MSDRSRAQRIRATLSALPWMPAVPLLLIIAAPTLLFSHYALRYHTFQNDELAYVQQARFIAQGFPGSLFDFTYLNRGLQRLNPALQGLVFGVLDGTETQFKAAHVMEVLLWASAAVPVYLFGRGLKLGRAALVPAALSVCVPWAVVSVSLLNESAAYAAVAWCLWAIWRAAVTPRLGNDVLALLTVLIAGLARTNLLVLGAVLAVVVVVQEWRATQRLDRHVRIRARVRSYPRRLLAAHPAVVLAVAAAAVYVGIHGTGGVSGSYPVPSLQTGLLWLKLKVFFAVLGEGLAFVPLALAAPWLIREALRPRSPSTGAFGVLGVSASVLIVYSTLGAGFEERYVMEFAPLVLLAFMVAVLRRQVSLVGTAVAAIVIARWISLVGVRPDQGPYDFFTYPAQTFYRRVVLGQASIKLPSALATHPATSVLVLAVLASLIAAVLAQRSRRTSGYVALAVAGAVGIFGLSVAVYSMSKFVDQAGEPGVGFYARTFVDRLGHGQNAAILDGGGGMTAYDPFWRELKFWNASLRTVVSYDGFSYPTWYPNYPPVGLQVDQRTGDVQVGGSLPQYLVTVPRYQAVGLNVQRVGSAVYMPLRLDVERFTGKPRATYYVSGPDMDGWMRPFAGRETTIRVFTAGGTSPGRCLSVLFTAPPGHGGRRVLTMVGPLGRLRVALTPGEQRTVGIPLPSGQPSAPFWTVKIAANGSTMLADGRIVTAHLTDLNVGRCGGTPLG